MFFTVSVNFCLGRPFTTAHTFGYFALLNVTAKKLLEPKEFAIKE